MVNTSLAPKSGCYHLCPVETGTLPVIRTDPHSLVMIDEEHFCSDLFKLGTLKTPFRILSNTRRKLSYSVSTLADCPGPPGMTISPCTRAFLLCFADCVCCMAVAWRYLDVVASCSYSYFCHYRQPILHSIRVW